MKVSRMNSSRFQKMMAMTSLERFSIQTEKAGLPKKVNILK